MSHWLRLLIFTKSKQNSWTLITYTIPNPWVYPVSSLVDSVTSFSQLHCVGTQLK